nr:hypothetical protein [Angustibacter aerolatus]
MSGSLLLEALEQPHRTTRVRRLALGCFVGATAADLALRGDALADDLSLLLRAWAQPAGGARGRRPVRGGRDRGSAAAAGARPARRRTPAHRPAARRADAARGGRREPARPDRPAHLAAAAAPRGRHQRRARAQPPARDRRGRGAGDDRAHQQGPGVPGGAGAVRLGPLPPPAPGHRAVPRRRRTPPARRRRRGVAGVGPARARAGRRRGRRGACGWRTSP